MPRKTKTLSGSDSVEMSRRKSGPSYWLFKVEPAYARDGSTHPPTSLPALQAQIFRSDWKVQTSKQLR
jgi:hypothetical protein